MEYREAAKRRFTLLDAMILVAATAIGLAAWRAARPGVQKRSEATVPVAILLAAWTWATLLVRHRPPRPPLRRLMSRPGDAGSVAAVLATVMTALASLLLYAGHLFFRSGIGLDAEDASIIGTAITAPAILASWLTLALGRRWRREIDWVGWMGRILGFAWLTAFVALWLTI
jgi:hypothetical protein